MITVWMPVQAKELGPAGLTAPQLAALLLAAHHPALTGAMAPGAAAHVWHVTARRLPNLPKALPGACAECCSVYRSCVLQRFSIPLLMVMGPCRALHRPYDLAACLLLEALPSFVPTRFIRLLHSARCAPDS